MATARQRKAVEKLVENGGKSVSGAMRAAGYSPATAENPSKLTKSKSWQQLLDQYLPEKKLTEAHKKLLNAKYLDHMVFPLATEEDTVRELLKSVGCTVRRFQYGETALHCWFWAPNTKAIKDAVELGYKVRGKLKADAGKITDPNGRVVALINMEPAPDDSDSSTDA